MKSNKTIFIIELLVAISISIVITMALLLMNGEGNDVLLFINKIDDKCFNLNLSLVVAFLISLITGKAFRYKDRNMKRVAKNSTTLFLVNSVTMVFYVWCGPYGVAIIISTLLGNVVKFLDITRNILEVI